jgi:hypothetical protein
MKNEAQIRSNQAKSFWFEYQNSSLIFSIYPEVREIEIKLKFNYDESQRVESIKKLTSTDHAFFMIECINRNCIHGGFDLSTDIVNLINRKGNQFANHKICNGYQDYKRFIAKNYHCLCKLDLTIEIIYNEN